VFLGKLPVGAGTQAHKLECRNRVSRFGGIRRLERPATVIRGQVLDVVGKGGVRELKCRTGACIAAVVSESHWEVEYREKA
jgi:hypothetical protein